jgi:hypothetical protein
MNLICQEKSAEKVLSFYYFETSLAWSCLFLLGEEGMPESSMMSLHSRLMYVLRLCIQFS